MKVQQVQQYVGGLVLALVASVGLAIVSSAPAEANTTTGTSASASHLKVTKTDAPRWARVRVQSGDRPGVLDSLSTDWSWWSPGPGWTIKFNRSETNRMAFAFGACTTIVGPFWPAIWAIALYAACAGVAFFAGWASVNGKCLSAFVPVTGWPVSFSTRWC